MNKEMKAHCIPNKPCTVDDCFYCPNIPYRKTEVEVPKIKQKPKDEIVIDEILKEIDIEIEKGRLYPPTPYFNTGLLKARNIICIKFKRPLVTKE